MSPLVFLGLAVVALLLLKWAWERSAMGRAARVVKNWPGPPRTFLFGNSLDFQAGPELAKQMLGHFERYGSPMRWSLGPIQGVHIFTAKHMEAMLKDTTNTRKGIEYDLLRPWLGDGLLNSFGPKWFRRRRQLTPAFHFGILKEFLGTFNTQTETLVRVLQAKAAATDGPFDVCPFISRAALDIICETAMGTTANAQSDADSPYVACLEEFGAILMHRMLRPWLYGPHYGWLPTSGRFRAILRTLHGFTDGVIQRRIRERRARLHQDGDDGQCDDGESEAKKRVAFLELLLDLMDKGELSLGDVKDEVDTFMFEGHDTTAAAMMWAVYSISRHPDVQTRLREEIAGVMGDRASLTTSDLGQLPYLDAVLKESQRMWPTVPFVTRILERDLVLDPTYTVPAGTPVYIKIHGLHRNADEYTDPGRFDPGRWTPEASAGRSPFAFVPFSGGSRNCIGQKFALMEMKVTLVALLRRFELRCAQAEADMSPNWTMVLRPHNGVRVALRPLP